MAVSAKAQLASVEDANGGVTSYTYDANSNQASVTDAEGNTTSYTYDKLDRVDSWEITRYQYDGRGLTTKMTDALGNVTTYTCDGDENLVSKTDADRFTTEYTYNRACFVTSNSLEDKQYGLKYGRIGARELGKSKEKACTYRGRSGCIRTTVSFGWKISSFHMGNWTQKTIG